MLTTCSVPRRHSKAGCPLEGHNGNKAMDKTANCVPVGSHTLSVAREPPLQLGPSSGLFAWWAHNP